MPYHLSRLATDTLCSWPHLFSIHQILPILKNPRQVQVSPWNLCWLLHLPPTSLSTEQVHFFKWLSHNLAINYILSCSLQRCLVPHADTISDMEINPILIHLRTRSSMCLKEIKLIFSFLCCSFFAWTRNGAHDCEGLHEVGGRTHMAPVQYFTATSFINEMEVRRLLNNAMDLGILPLV